jgi:A/G-specific adenine glycosylase
VKRDLPWRTKTDSYSIWISEIMLQQTQVDTVIDYYNRFINRFPNIQSLASASEEEVFKLWEGLGYYSRARNLHKCAQVLVEEYDGFLPKDEALLKKLPGIGPYTAGAIMSIAFNAPYPAVDGNVMRVIARHNGMSNDLSLSGTRKVFEEVVSGLIPEDASGFNQGLMELGALVCTPRNPKCRICPVRETCHAFMTDTQGAFPVKSKKIKKTMQYIAFAYIEIDGKILFEKTEGSGLLSGLWSLPSTVVEDWDVAERSVTEMLEQEYLIEVIRLEAVKDVKHVFTHKVWHMRLFKVKGNVGGLYENEHRWVDPQSIDQLPLSRAIQKLLEGM